MSTDRCARCFQPLKQAPSQSAWERSLYACENCPPNSGYLTTARPSDGHTHKACVMSNFGRPTLHYYGKTP
jgi:hypothetical protein